MEFTAKEKMEIEKHRIVAILKEKESSESLTIEQLAEEYERRHKSGVVCYKEAFVSLEAFLKYACGVNITAEGKLCLSTCSTENVPSNGKPLRASASSALHLVSKPQFSPFFGFSDGDKSKGVPYNVWRFEVDGERSIVSW